jgi:phenylpropionate dioxygenase-like ring-hydroxylating dioxygenase large terminal subunit
MATDEMVTKMRTNRETPYDAAVLGFKNYWYPISAARKITTKPLGIRIMSQQIMLMRGQKDGKVYALADECVH